MVAESLWQDDSHQSSDHGKCQARAASCPRAGRGLRLVVLLCGQPRSAEDILTLDLTVGCEAQFAAAP